MYIAERLAEFANESGPLAATTEGAVRRAVIDLISAAIAGADAQGFRAACKAAPHIWGSGPVPVWFGGPHLSKSGAAFCNAACASLQDLDDGHRAAAGHPGASIIPAVLAACSENRPFFPAVRAVAVGYEVAVRISAARDFSTLSTMSTGLWCGQGVAAAVGFLEGLPSRTVAQAIAFAGISAPHQAPLAYTEIMGTDSKEGIPWATALGFSAVELAAADFTAPIDFLDNGVLYDGELLTRDLGRTWMIESAYFKPYGCCRWAHSAIDAMLAILTEDTVAIKSITAIEIDTFGRALTLNNEPTPKSLQAAQYSVPFCVALAAYRGAEALLPMAERALDDEEVKALARKITLSVDLNLDAMFSAAVPARVRVTTGNDQYTRTVLAPRGEPNNPLSDDDLVAKLWTVANGRLPDRRVQELLASVDAFMGGDPKPLTQYLSKPLSNH